jgi:hypothetical protein
MVLEPSTHRSQRANHVTVPGADPFDRRGEPRSREDLGSDGAEVGGEQHDVHVEVQTFLKGQTRLGDTVLGVDREREFTERRGAFLPGVRRGPTSP